MDVASFAYTLVAFLIALGVLIFVHELGHFWVAKKVGVLVQRFSIGFGPILFRRRRGETEYAISALPLGGYVKMLGEEDDAEPEVASQPERAFQRQGLGARAAIVVAGPAMNFLFAFVAYALVFAFIGVETPSNTTRVGGVSAGLPAEMAGLRADDVIKAVDGRPVATWEELSKAVVASEGKTITLTVDAAARSSRCRSRRSSRMAGRSSARGRRPSTGSASRRRTSGRRSGPSRPSASPRSRRGASRSSSSKGWARCSSAACRSASSAARSRSHARPGSRHVRASSTT
jgi:membrane-associated protease RseP (regulator of RpoE activity)